MMFIPSLMKISLLVKVLLQANGHYCKIMDGRIFRVTQLITLYNNSTSGIA
jgi:hypothetical protein